MATKDVLVVRMENGEIESLVWDHREVYTNASGREYIKTRGDGNINIQDRSGNRVAVIAYRRVPSASGRFMVRRKYGALWYEVEHALAQKLGALGLDEAAASMV